MTFPVFASGDVLNASDMNAVGLWLVKTQTIGSAVSSVTVTGAFSSDYDNYRITVTGGVASALTTLSLQLGSTTTGYYGFTTYGTPGGTGITGEATNNASSIGVGGCSTNSIQADIQICNPNVAKFTHITSVGQRGTTTIANAIIFGIGGFLADTTQYTAFTLTPQTGTLTGGAIKVYGYRN